MFAGFRADIDDVVRSSHGVVIVFDDDEGIAQVAQVAQGVEELVIVPLMEADRRFIEDVEDADQARSDLSGQANALGFAAGQGACRPRQSQVIEADSLEKGQASLDFLKDLLTDELLLFRQFQIIKERDHIPNR